MTAFSLLVGWALAQTPAPMGTYAVGGVAVRPAIPAWSWTEPAGALYQAPDGSRLAVDGDRTVGPYTNLSWAQIAERIAAQGDAAPARKWRVRVLVLQVLSQPITVDGVHCVRRSSLEDDAETGLKNELGLFAALVRVETNNKVQIDFDYDLEPEPKFVPMREDLDDLGLAEVRARLTGADENSFFVIHPARTLSFHRAEVAGIPGSQVPFWAAYDRARPGVLARHLYGQWLDHLRQTATARGVRGLPKPSATISGFTFQSEQMGLLEPYAIAIPPAVDAVAFGAANLRSRLQVPAPVRPDPATGGYQPAARATIPAKLSNPFNSGDAEQLAASGAFAMKTVADDERGSVGSLREWPYIRRGWVRLLQNDDATTRVGANPFLEFWIKVRGKGSNLSLIVETDRGSTVYNVFDPLANVPVTLEGFTPFPTTRLALPASSAWQKVVIELGSRNELLRGIYLAAPPDEFARPTILGATPEILIDDVVLTAQPSQPPVAAATDEFPAPSARSSVPLLRSRWIAGLVDPVSETAQVELRALLSDDSPYVILSALDAYGKYKIPSAVPEIGKSARSFDSSICRAAVAALAFQDTAAAWDELDNISRTGPFDHNRRFGVEAISNRNQPGITVSQFSTLLTARSWETRLAAARAIQKLKAKASQIVAVTFLNEADPLARERMLAGLDATQPQVAARLIEMVGEGPSQEPSPWVRGVAAARLVASPQPKAQAAVRSLVESGVWLARLGFVQSLELASERREVWRMLLKDEDARVRLAAASRFAEWATEDAKDWESLRQETDLRVVLAAIQAATAKNFTIPTDIIELRNRLLEPQNG